MTQVWLASVKNLEEEGRFGELYAALPEHRRAKVDKIRFEKDKRLSLGAWVLLEQGLKSRGIVKFSTACTPEGKPYLTTHPEVHFSLSHSGEMVMCAISSAEVGCDIEQLRELNLPLAKRFFTPEEYAAIVACVPGEEQRQMFFRLWTLKESFMKAVGLGLALPMSDFSVDVDKCWVRQQVAPQKNYHFREYFDLQGYCCACCSEAPGFSELKYTQL